MTGYGIIMIIFGILILLVGLHIYTGHDFFLARGYYKKESKEYLKGVGKVMFCVACAPICSGIVAFFIKTSEGEIIPILILLIGVVLGFLIPIKRKEKKEKKNAK